MTDKCREEFERELKRKEPNVRLERDGDGYKHPFNQFDWEMWQVAWKAAHQTKPDPIFQCDDTPINKAYEG